MQFELITADGRLFDLDVWDWSMMVGGSLLVGLVALLGNPNSPGGEFLCNQLHWPPPRQSP